MKVHCALEANPSREGSLKKTSGASSEGEEAFTILGHGRQLDCGCYLCFVFVCVAGGGQRVPVHRGHVKVEKALHVFSSILTFCGRQDLSPIRDMAT